MPSPFPGMNPYLERPEDWGDFHESFIPFFRATIEAALPEPYRTRIDENLYIHELSAEERMLVGRADMHLTERPLGERSSTATLESPLTALAPVAIDEESYSFIQILDKRNEDVIAVIEMLSPSNKTAGADGDAYRNKIRRLLRSPTHIVEIDFLRAGRRSVWLDLAASDYSVVVSRAEDRPKVAHWPISLREALPRIPIPLRDGDGEIWVNPKPALEQVYDTARYARYLYKQPPSPPLGADDAAWAAEILAAVPR